MVNGDAVQTAPPSETARRHIFVLLNPISGRSQPDTLRGIIEQTFAEVGASYTLHEIAEGDDLTAIVRAAVEEGHTDVVAGGGDGTVSAVATALVHSEARMGILPVGTANVLARELNIPLDPAQAVALVAGPNRTAVLDAMGLGDRVSLLQVDVGLNSVMIRDTQTWAKRLVGRAAYLWTGFTRLVGLEPRRFRITVDGVRHSTPAMQVVIANSGLIGMRPFRWGPGINPSDGQIDIAVLRARTLLDILHLAWVLLLGLQRISPNIHYMHARRSIEVGAHPPLPVQADGEIIGDTPCTIEVIPAAVRVIVPPEPEAPPQAAPAVGEGETND